MTWNFCLFLGPVALLVIVLLFGFVGCVGDDVSGISTTDQGNGNPDPIATTTAKGTLEGYWLLAEPSGTKAGDTAVDKQGLHPGTYKTATLAADASQNSPASAAPPVLNLGVPGLQDYIPNTGMQVNGGYVEIPFSPLLNPSAFSVVLLVQPEWDRTVLGNYYCVLESTAPAPSTAQGKRLGYAIYAGPASPDPGQPYKWQVWLGDGSSFQRVPDTKPTASVVEFDRTLLALTYDGSHLKFYIYYPGSVSDPKSASDLDNITAIDSSVAFQSNANDESLFLGVGRALFPVGTGTTQELFYPFDGQLQDVAVYRNTLSDADVASLVLANFQIAS